MKKKIFIVMSLNTEYEINRIIIFLNLFGDFVGNSERKEYDYYKSLRFHT